MDTLIQLLSVLVIFSMLHERVIEMLRLPKKLLKDQEGRLAKLLDAVTIGPFNWISAVAFAIFSHADVLAVFRQGGLNTFVAGYMSRETAWTPAHVMGCVLLGCSATLGSQFWHDALKGLVEFRTRANTLSSDLQQQLPPDVLSQLLKNAATHLDADPQAQANAPAAVAAALRKAADAAAAPKPPAGA